MSGSSFRGSRDDFPRLLVLSLLAMLAFSLRVGPAGAISSSGLDDDGRIAGQVRDSSGEPIQGAEVSILRWDEGYSQTLTADSHGRYASLGIPNDRYTVRFVAPGKATEWWDDEPVQWMASEVEPQPTTTQTCDATLTAPGGLIGTVKDSVTGQPLGGVSVELIPDGETAHIASTTTNGLGRYSFSGSKPGTYTLTFSNILYLDTEKTDVVVPEGETASMGETMITRLASIEGVVTDEDTGAGIECQVLLYGKRDGVWVLASSAYAGPTGRYLIPHLDEAGTYRVHFTDPSPRPTYLSEWWDDKPSGPRSDPVSVSFGQARTGVDAELTLGGTMSGTVVDEATQEPVIGYVTLYYSPAGTGTWGVFRREIPTTYGNWEARGLPEGFYRVLYTDVMGEHAYVFSGGATTLAGASSITAGPSRATPVQYQTMGPAGRISGRLTVSGVPTSGICVYPYVWQSASQTWEFVEPWTYLASDSSGDYTVTGLATGHYRLLMGRLSGSPFQRLYWPGTGTIEAAQDVTVTAGLTTTGIDMDMSPPADSLPLAAVTGLQAECSGKKVRLTWTNPAEADFAGVRVVRHRTQDLTDPEAGTRIYEGDSQSCWDSAEMDDGDWHYTVFAKDTQDNWGAPASVTVNLVTTPVTVHLSASPSSIPYGGTANLVTTLVDEGGRPFTGVVRLQEGTTASGIGSGGTVVESEAYIAKRPPRKTWYRAVFDGDYEHLPATSTVVTVTPGVRLKTPVVPARVYVRRSFTTYGYYYPVHYTRNVTFVFYRWHGGRWVRGRGPLKASYSQPAGCTKAYVRTYLPYRGTWKVKAVSAADSKHSAGQSRYRTFRVR